MDLAALLSETLLSYRLFYSLLLQKLQSSSSSLAQLWLQGDKLRPQAQIGSYPIQNGEFLVLVPFAKKDSKARKSEASSTPSNAPHHSDSTSNLADSTWSNIMEDLTHLCEATEGDTLDRGNNASNFEFGTVASEPRKEKLDNEARTVRRFGPEKQMELPYHLILNTLEYTSEGTLGEHNCEAFSKVLESVNCLSDLPLGHCKLFKRARAMGGSGLRPCADGGGGSSTCLCPAWLKMVMKAFAFINIFSAFLHLQGRKMTSWLLEEALNRLGKFGIKLGLQDVKHLSLLCPQVNLVLFFILRFIYFFQNVIFYACLFTL